MHNAVKISSFGFCRSRESVTPGEEPGSQFKFSKKLAIFQRGNWFPIWVIRVPHTKFQERVIFKLWEPGSPREEPGSTDTF